MKLKYYLRGVGIGIIFATLVMTVSALVHKYNLSDEYIMKEARKLGMVMAEETKGDTLFVEEVTEHTEDTEVNSQEESESQSVPATQPESESESTTSESTAPESESGTPESESTTPESESTAPEPSNSESTAPEADTPASSESEGYATITIVRGDYARQVGEKLFQAGVLKSADEAEEFRKYMGTHGYAQSIHAGTYQIPLDATYEEICKIVAG